MFDLYSYLLNSFFVHVDSDPCSPPPHTGDGTHDLMHSRQTLPTELCLQLPKNPLKKMKLDRTVLCCSCVVKSPCSQRECASSTCHLVVRTQQMSEQAWSQKCSGLVSGPEECVVPAHSPEAVVGLAPGQPWFRAAVFIVHTFSVFSLLQESTT